MTPTEEVILAAAGGSDKMDNKFKKLPFIITFLFIVLILHRLAGESFTIGFLTVVLLGMVYTKFDKLNKFLKGVLASG